MKNILLLLSLLFFQLSFSQVITFECNNTIMAVSWEEIVNNPNAYMDWDEDGDIDEEDALIYLYQAYECDNQIVDCEEYITIVYDCACLDNQEIIFWEEIDESNCEINQMCECVVINNDINWNNIDWEDSDWEDFNWDEVWSDYDLGNIIDWNNAPWDDIIDLDIDPEDLINYIQNMLLGQSFDWDNFVEMQGGTDECCINPEWIDPMAMCLLIYDPVIGCDGIEYGNSCQAEAAGVTIYVDSTGNEETVLEWDCNLGDVDCIDDPNGILEEYSYQCNDIVGDWFSWDCNDDLSVAVPGAPSGMWMISDLCPQSCTDCEQEEECVAQLIPDCMFMTVIDPVCGCDGVTYSNSGEAACNNIFNYTLGECETIINGCTLSDGSNVPNGWSGNGVGNNWCNSCFCEDGILSCTEMWCGEIDCIDDPEDILAQYGSSCSELAILGCDADLSDFIPGIGFGISVYEICQESCGDCGDDIEGCMDMNACNYNEEATIDDGSCDYGVQCLVSPCTTTPSPYPGASCVDDYCEGCCAIWSWSSQDGDFSFNTCEDEYIEGCTETNAINFNSDAILDDGSCEYAWEDCDIAESPIDVETFDVYNLGNIDSQSIYWIGWDNGNSGVDVVDFSMNTYLGDGQSILVEQDDDLVWDLDGLNSGSGELTFYMYIPSTDDAGAYYNMLHDYNGANSNWAFQVLFASASSGDQSYIDLDQPVYFDAVYDTWVEVRHEIDIDNDLISLFYNGEFMLSWAWSNGSAGISSVLDALNLYGFCTGEPCTGMAYYDNIKICGNFYDNSDIEDDMNISKKLIKVTDILGREIDGSNKKQVLLYIYDDGSINKKYFLEKK